MEGLTKNRGEESREIAFESFDIKVDKEVVGTIAVPAETSDEEIKRMVFENEAVKKLTEGKRVKQFHLSKMSRKNTAHIFLS